MANRTPMVCPKCGATMNRHAEKLVEPRDANEVARAVAALGGIVQEFHYCPKCGGVAERAGS